MVQKEDLRPIVVRYHNGKGYEERNGYFHGWVGYLADDCVNETWAIIEWLNGECTTMHIGCIKFTDRG